MERRTGEKYNLLLKYIQTYIYKYTNTVWQLYIPQ